MLAMRTPTIAAGSDGGESRATLAVLDFDYVDTSGEARDQRSEHETRLENFMRALKSDLATRGKLRLVVPACRPAPCSLAQSTASEVLKAAREAGADLLMMGTIHKMSTLVQWAKVEAVDTRTGRPVVDKLFTFRGDTDEAWARAETFITDEIMTTQQRSAR